MGNFSLVALPANLAVLPVIPITMILGFVTAFAGLISKVLALAPALISFILLKYELATINFFSHLPLASLTIPDFPFSLTIFIYLILFYYIFARSGKNKTSPRLIVLVTAILLTILTAGFLSLRHYESNRAAKQNLEAILLNATTENPNIPFSPDQRIKSSNCLLRGPLPDHECTPGAVFPDATIEKICVKGYTKTVRNVSTKLRKQVFAEYGILYPQPTGAYEVDHLIPLAIGGSNDIANLFPEAAVPIPGFHEKDIVEVYLQQEVCNYRVALSTAQRQAANDWLAVYNNLTPEEILTLKRKYAQ